MPFRDIAASEDKGSVKIRSVESCAPESSNDGGGGCGKCSVALTAVLS